MQAKAAWDLGNVLLIESGPRSEGEKAVANLYGLGAGRVDILTCFNDPLETFDQLRGSIISVHSEAARANRKEFIRDLCAASYTSVIVLWVGSGVLRNWALAIGAQTFSRLWLMDRDGEIAKLNSSFRKSLWRIITKPLVPVRNATLHWDVSDSLLSRTGEIVAAPFQFSYLIGFTLAAHAARWLRIALRQTPGS